MHTRLLTRSVPRCAQWTSLWHGDHASDGCVLDETGWHLFCMLSGLVADLDALGVCGGTDIRSYRREVVEGINKLLKYLDLEEEADT